MPMCGCVAESRSEAGTSVKHRMTREVMQQGLRVPVEAVPGRPTVTPLRTPNSPSGSGARWAGTSDLAESLP